MLVVLTSHPIQYQAPLWRALAEEFGKGREASGEGREGEGVSFEVWFLTDQGLRRTEDRDFGKAFAWDVDLLSGYPHRFLDLRGAWNMHKFEGISLAKPIGESLRAAGATALWVEGWRFKPLWDAVSAAKQMRIPVFLRGETSDKIAEKGGLFGLVRNFALHRLFAKVDYFLAIGQASRRFYLRHGVAESKLIHAPYCVDNDFFRAESTKTRGPGQPASGKGGAVAAHSESKRCASITEKQKAIRVEWNIPLDANVVMFCGKFISKKRPMDLLSAASAHFGDGNWDHHGNREVPSQTAWHLLFVGSGELGADLREACDVRFDADRQNDRASNPPNASAPPASFVGFLNQSQICKAYAIADVLVLPSEAWETWGLVVNEATASGIPTVVSDDCGCADDFGAQNPYTRVFPVGDTVALAAAIEAGLALGAKAEVVTTYADGFSPQITAEAVVGRLKDGSSS